jgi:O-acetyl-ADP-ribose deacetylase (regulator of RNase III)
MKDFGIILVNPGRPLCDEFREHFHGLPRVEVAESPFESLPAFDCMVSAANSFGLMDGGVDYAISEFFGRDLQKKVQARIIEEYDGEQPVGTSMIVETGHPRHPYVAHTPTMRIPMPIRGTDNVYLAMKAWLNAVRRHNVTSDRAIASVACPGLGTATGAVPYPEAARQMALAYRNFLNRPDRITWAFAEARQREIGRGGSMP